MACKIYKRTIGIIRKKLAFLWLMKLQNWSFMRSPGGMPIKLEISSIMGFYHYQKIWY